MVYFANVTIIGVGLIGGSLAKALKARGIAGTVIGAGRGRETLETALRLGVIDRIAPTAAEGAAGADLVVLAMPVGGFETTVREIAPALKQGAVLTDVGSVKGGLVRSIEEMLPAGVHFVPAHPIAGKEKSGVAEASESLFQGARCIVTPTERTDPGARERVMGLWSAVGAMVLTMDPDTHDKVFAAVSHLPHVAAYALVNAVAGLKTGTDDYTAFSGAGFRDFTRIAASSPEMWTDICLLNRENLVPMIERYQSWLDRLKTLILAGDSSGIRECFFTASEHRKALE